MPDHEFIHSRSDVTSTLLYALDSGLQPGTDTPQTERRPYFLSSPEIIQMERGVFVLIRPQWVFGPLQFMTVSGGENRGKFFISPSVNCSPITIYFSGERLDGGRRRFGACTVGYNRDWLELPAKTIRPTPSEVKVWFKRIVGHLSTKVVVKAGVHNYEISRGVYADPGLGDSLPPFDFIPWPPVRITERCQPESS